MEKTHYMVTFAHVVQAGSFVGAAKRLKLAPSVISKHISKLEKEVGARLLNRSTRSLSLTETGTVFYEHCARILEEVEQSERAVASLQSEPQGKLRVSTTHSMINSLLMPMLPGFIQEYPEVQLELVANERLVDIVEEGFDIALRITKSPAPNLVARPLSPMSFHVMGTPAYFRRSGVPETPEDLQEHICLSYPEAIVDKWALDRNGVRVEVEVGGPIRINSVEAIKKLVLQDMGLALLPVYSVVPELSSGRLVVALPKYKGFGEATLYAVHLQHRYGAPKIRAFVDYLSTYVRRLELADISQMTFSPTL